MINDDADQSVWIKGSDQNDMITASTTMLILRSDGSYTKQFGAVVGRGIGTASGGYGGTHNGRWTSEGNLVHLSGDGNWPSYTEDLSLFRQVR